MFRKCLLALAASVLLAGGVHSATAQELAERQVLRLGVGVDDIATVDPHVAVGLGDWPILAAVYDALTRFPRGTMDAANLEPGLATSWELDESGTVWTFHLREGVKWHGDFGDFTADDVKFSIERVQDEATGSPYRQVFDPIVAVEVVDDLTVQITTDAIVPNLPALLVNNNVGYIVSKAAVEAGMDLRTHPIGTGPFMYGEYRSRESFSLVANPDYWNGAPVLERAVIQFMPDGATRELALMSGEIHGIEIPAQQDAIDRMRANGMEVDLTAPANTFTLHMNMSVDPISDIRVRQALAAGIDREALVNFFGADVAYAEFSPLPKGYIGHTSDTRWVPYDPEAARALLAEAGFADGLNLTMAISNSNIYLSPMQVIQEMWRGIGVNLQLNVVDHPTYHSMIRENANPVVIYGAFRYPLDGTAYLTEFYHSASAIGQPTAVTNFSHIGQIGPSIDKLVDDARTEVDPEKQIAMWQEAQHTIMDEVASVPLFTRNYALARSPKLDLGFPSLSHSFYLVTEKARLLK